MLAIVVSMALIESVRADVIITGNQGGQLNDNFSTCTLGGTPNPNIWITTNTAQISIDDCLNPGYLTMWNLCGNPIYGYNCGTSSDGGIISQSQFDPILPAGKATFYASSINVHRADNGASANPGTLTLFWNHEANGAYGVSTSGETWYVGARICVCGGVGSQQTNFYAIWNSPAGQYGVNLGTLPAVGLNVNFRTVWQRYNGNNFMTVHMDTIYNSITYNYDYTIYPTGSSPYQGMNDQHAYTLWVETNINAEVYLA